MNSEPILTLVFVLTIFTTIVLAFTVGTGVAILFILFVRLVLTLLWGM